MSKRRNRNNNANISQETLERARRQAAETKSDDEVEEAAPAVSAAPRVRASAATPARRSAAGSSVRKRKNDDKMSPEMVADLLSNPTKEVTEEELRSHYSYVVADLRNMGLLAAGLMVALVVLAQILPR